MHLQITPFWCKPSKSKGFQQLSTKNVARPARPHFFSNWDGIPSVLYGGDLENFSASARCQIIVLSLCCSSSVSFSYFCKRFALLRFSGERARARVPRQASWQELQVSPKTYDDKPFCMRRRASRAADARFWEFSGNFRLDFFPYDTIFYRLIPLR